MLLPTERDRLLAADAGGWTSSAQVTATGCSSVACATASGTWARSESGRGGLRSTVSGTSGRSGQATVTWRSGLFAGPASAGRATWTLFLADRRAVASPSTAQAIYTVRILDQTLGTARTIVDRAPVPPASDDGLLVEAPPVPLPTGVISASSAYRLELTVRLSFGTSAGDGAVDVAAPQLAVEPLPAPSAPASPVPLPTPTVRLPAAGGTQEGVLGNGAPTGADAATDPDAEEAPADSGGRFGRCLDGHDVAILGASGRARRLSVVGVADAEPGTAVALVSGDGSVLGSTRVAADGRFVASVTEPANSAGIGRVQARLGDGARSAEVDVERRNVLRSARRTGARIELRGALSPALARRGRLAATLEVSTGTACEVTTRGRVVRFVVDRTTGTYRAVFSVPENAGAAGQIAVAPPLLRVRIARAGPGSGRSALVSQMIFARGSDRGGT